MGSGPGGVWEWTEASADADGSFLEGRSPINGSSRSQVEVLEILRKFWKLNESGWKWVPVGESWWKKSGN